jgi:hypothetical protein
MLIRSSVDSAIYLPRFRCEDPIERTRIQAGGSLAGNDSQEVSSTSSHAGSEAIVISSFKESRTPTGGHAEASGDDGGINIFAGADVGHAVGWLVGILNWKWPLASLLVLYFLSKVTVSAGLVSPVTISLPPS